MNLPNPTPGESTELVPGRQAERYLTFDQTVPGPVVDHNTLSDYWRILLKRRWFVVIPVVLSLVLGAFTSLRTVPVYEAVTQIAINRESTDLLPGKDGGFSASSEDFDPAIVLETQVRVLQSDTMALQVVHNLQLDKRPAFGGSPAASNRPGTVAAMDNAREAGLINRFHGAVKVRTIPSTRLIEIRFRSTDPKLAAETANDLANSFIEQNVRSKFDSTMQAADWLSKQLVDLQLKVETSQEKLVKYQKEHEIVGLDEKQNITTQKLDALNSQLTTAEVDRVQKETAYRIAVKNPQTNTTPTVGLLGRLLGEESDLKNQLAQLTIQNGPSHPKVAEVSARLKQVQASIDNEQKNNVKLAEAEYNAANQRVTMFRAALENQKKVLNTLNESAIEFNLLKRDSESNRQLYEGMLQKMKEAGISAGLKSSNVRVVDAARVPLVPVVPDIPRNMEVALMLGLTVGIAMALGAEVLDQTIRMPSDVELFSRWAALGIIPKDRTKEFAVPRGASARAPRLPAQASASPTVLMTRPNSETAEAYRSLRTAVLLSNPAAPPKIILITSALPQEGKTTTIVNLAIAFAQQGRRVLLVDADLRRPAIHRVLNACSGEGLSSMLSMGVDVQPVFPISNLPNLHVLTAGPHRVNAAELLSSPRMRDAMEMWREQYDHVFIDSPPALSVTDAVVMSVWADSTMIVVRSGVTSKNALRRVRALFDQVNANVLGAVLNAVDLRSPDYYYYYYSGSKYGSYYHDRAE